MKIGQAIYAAPGATDDGVKVKENVNGEGTPEEPTVEAEVEDEEKK
jgi:hypothetical protein